MASMIFPMSALHRGYVTVAGSFAPNGVSAVAAGSNEGVGFSVARTSTGLFTITFDRIYPELVGAMATLQLHTAADKFVQVGDYVKASKTIQIRVWDVSDTAVADVAVSAYNRINFCFTFKYTG